MPPASTRWAASSATAGRSGTAVPRRRAPLPEGRQRLGAAPRRRGCSAAPTSIGHEEREAEQSINFVTCHDGFTLNDLVSYNHKHNEANGEDNRDGSDDNMSWNCGVEGPDRRSRDRGAAQPAGQELPGADAARGGTPMLLMGDEVRRTQRGNNNAYCQDSDISWFDWTLLQRHADIHRFVKMLNAFRQRRDVVTERAVLTLNELLARAQIEWHGVTLDQPGLERRTRIRWRSRCEACAARFLLHVMINAYWEPLTFELPRRCRATFAVVAALYRYCPCVSGRHLSVGCGSSGRTSHHPPGAAALRGALALALAGNRLNWRRTVTQLLSKELEALTADETPLVTNELELMDAYWRACNYLSVGHDLPEGQPAAAASR